VIEYVFLAQFIFMFSLKASQFNLRGQTMVEDSFDRRSKRGGDFM
jgi:hypothetical protein